MQKDVHYYLTYYQMTKIGLNRAIAEKIAWANQFTDDCTDANKYGFQTQIGLDHLFSNINNRQIQETTTVAFHFLPTYYEKVFTYKTRMRNELSHILMLNALNQTKNNDYISLGIAIHSFQDTFSHHNFSGLNEQGNSCFKWDNLNSIIPNIGHAELRHLPDMVNIAWTDPRTNEFINNKSRVEECQREIFLYFEDMFKYNHVYDDTIIKFIDEKNYEKRKNIIIKEIDCPRYSDILGKYLESDIEFFVKAAHNQLSIVHKYISDNILL